MAKRPKQRVPFSVSPAMLRNRVERAVEEGRYQHALELSKQLYKQDPSAGSRELLFRVYLGRAQQLRKQGFLHDAQTLLEHALQLDGGAAGRLECLAEELALCGAWRRALELAQRFPGSALQSRILAQAVDSAFLQGPAGWKQLPEQLAGPFDLILQAFAQLEAGEDERVRETLQGVGLQAPGSPTREQERTATSPFLEWKVFLRGLLAFYHDADERALENWQRLDPARLPARLAAPLRLQIDPAYRHAQPPALQAALQKQADRLQASGLVQPLRTLQAVLADSKQLPQAFRLADGLVQALRQQFPHLVPRLAACFYWAVIHSGQPEDVCRYERVFGTPADDPGLDRLRALLFEHLGDMGKAHHYWRQFEASVARNPAAWPGEQARHVRALIWCRMGRNAASIPDLEKFGALPPFLRDHPDRPRPLSPTAPECFRRSLELAPDLLAAHKELLHYHQAREESAAAEQAARRLLEHFPEHVPTLEELAEIRGQQGDYAESLKLRQRALKINPLDRSLRRKVGAAHLCCARMHAEGGGFAEARAEYQKALSYREGKGESAVLCPWAACEFKAREPVRAEALLQQALAQSGSRLAVAFNMLIETIRLKLPSRLQARFKKEFTAGLTEPATAAAAVALAETAACQHRAGVRYRGQKTHEKQVLVYLHKALELDFTEEEQESIANALLDMQAPKVLRRYTSHGRHRFPHNPHFYFLEAESYFAQGPCRFPAWKVQPLLTRAGQLARALPGDEKQKALLEKIEHRQQLLGITSFLFGPQSLEMIEEMFGRLLDNLGEDDDGYKDRH